MEKAGNGDATKTLGRGLAFVTRHTQLDSLLLLPYVLASRFFFRNFKQKVKLSSHVHTFPLRYNVTAVLHYAIA